MIDAQGTNEKEKEREIGEESKLMLLKNNVDRIVNVLLGSENHEKKNLI